MGPPYFYAYFLSSKKESKIKAATVATVRAQMSAIINSLSRFDDKEQDDHPPLLGVA